MEPIFTKKNDFRRRMESLVLTAQEKITEQLSKLDGNRFKRDKWFRKDGSGGGIVNYIQNGNCFEKGGINVSVSFGELPEAAQKHMLEKSEKISDYLKNSRDNVRFYSASMSSVIHPLNPHVPTIHFNYRYFEIGDESLNKDDFVTKHWWFGGGCDLTPSIIYPSDCKHFHSVYKKICNKYFHRSYDLFKKKCDEYFYIPYRKEHRGVGGVFFDDLNGDREKIFSFVAEMANAFELSFIPIVSKRLNLEYSDRQKEWQEIRRGRYVEFNLLFDRGTKFGMNRENANFEAIFISMPLKARFVYKAEPVTESEKFLVKVLKNPIDWINFEND